LTALDQGGTAEQTVLSAPQVGSFWKTHPSVWPVGSITIGGITYTESQLLQVLQMSTGGDAVLILTDQLIAAELNILSGAPHSATTDATIAQSNSLLAGINLLTHTAVKGTTTLGSQMIADAGYLEKYNNAKLI
jgi:hypothetical protein